MNRYFRVSLALALSLVFWASGPSFAANLEVTSTAASCSDCDPTNDCSGDCSDPGVVCPFQEALNIAQCNDQDDTITLAAGTYNPNDVPLADTGCSDDGFCYDGDSNAENFSLTITGAGKGLTFIDGGGNNISGLMIEPLATDDDGLNLTVTGITFQNNGPVSGSDAGGLLAAVQNATVLIQDNEFINNGGERTGGGLFVGSFGTGVITVNRNAFFDNQALSGVPGGGIGADVLDGELILTNNILAGNLAENNTGGGIYIEIDGIAPVRIIHNTLFDNTAVVGGGILLEPCVGNTTDIYNNIIWQNTADAGGEDVAVVAGGGGECTPDGTINLFNNDIINFEVLPGTITVNEGNNVDVDPLWAASAADDFHLTADSPVIDQGDLSPPGGLPSPDFDLVTRPQGPLPDMGALEFQVIPTPTPTPTATATPTPPFNAFLEGSGCSLGLLAGSPSAIAWLAAFGLLSAFSIRRHR